MCVTESAFLQAVNVLAHAVVYTWCGVALFRALFDWLCFRLEQQ